MSVVAMGIDVGATKTGMTVFHLLPEGDKLVSAFTAKVKPLPLKGTEAKRRKRARDKPPKKAFKPKSAENEVYAMDSDFARAWDMVGMIRGYIKAHKPAGIFLEMPGGGAKAARANRLMGGATFMMGAVLLFEKVPFQLFRPEEVERALGINLKPGEAKELTTAAKTKWKKTRMQNAVCSEWPLFKGWPDTEERAEDAIDSAAAFLCGRFINTLYSKLRSKVDEQ